MKTESQNQNTAKLAPETQEVLSEKMDAYLRKFGVGKRTQGENYSNFEGGIYREVGEKKVLKKLSFSTIYKYYLKGDVFENTTIDVLKHFGFGYCKETWELEGVIKHVENGEK